MLEAGWLQTRKARGLSFFSPPEALGIRGKYTIALPDDPTQSSVSSLIHDAADSLVQVYGYGQIGDLLNRAASLSDLDRSTRIISRFLDDTTREGAMPLAALASFVNSMEAALYSSAKFRLGHRSKAPDLVAKQFVNDCLFLQTAAGSFVAKVEIPPTVLLQADLFGEPQLDSADITSSLFSAIQFLTERILGTDIPFDDTDILANTIFLFNVELLTALSNVLLGPQMQSIEFSFELGSRVRMTSTGWISAERRDRLRAFVEFVKDQLQGEDNINVKGAIVELRSRDPEGDRNYIRVVADFYGDRTFLTAILTNIQYQRAVDAHRSKRSVHLVGKGIRLRTQVRITELHSFD